MNLKMIVILLLIFLEYVKAFNENEMTNSDWVGSLMFNNKQFEELNNAIDFYQGNSQLYRQNLKVGEDPKKINEYNNPKLSENIFLASLIYNSENDWIIWINDKKITSNEGREIFINDWIKLNIIKVSASEIILELSTEKIDILSSNWDKELEEFDQSIFKSKKYDIIYDIKEKKIQFSLKPNQSFIIHKLKIVEGEQIPMRLSE